MVKAGVGAVIPEAELAVDLETLKVSASESPETAMANLNTVGINNLHRDIVLHVISI